MVAVGFCCGVCFSVSVSDEVPLPTPEQVAAAGRGEATHAGEPPASGVGR